LFHHCERIGDGVSASAMMLIGDDDAAGKASEEQRNGLGNDALPIFFI
jgi:hypothetical protein